MSESLISNAFMFIHLNTVINDNITFIKVVLRNFIKAITRKNKLHLRGKTSTSSVNLKEL